MRHAVKVKCKMTALAGILLPQQLTDPINSGVHSSTGRSSHRPLTAHPTVFAQPQPILGLVFSLLLYPV